VPFLSALKVCSQRGAIQIHVYIYLTLPYLTCYPATKGVRDIQTMRSARLCACPVFPEHAGAFWGMGMATIER